ncbi:hypothetical protein L6164_033834 [Bauhinia variegata]|uniref:Uncharacterized protein n=1 Tax=Bauhinia variegata TaxID=167791 RepID=A0ACB9KT14_BAUVA|nr:hypothetical protein L6164_033834 [Bauhinia variegata]
MEEAPDHRKLVAVLTCIGMALTYVLILYVPTVVFRLPPPASFENFMIRRFICAIVSTILSLFISTLFLPVRTWAVPYLLSVYGIRLDHFWSAVVFPLCLTSLMYAGSLFIKSLSLVDSWKEHRGSGGGLSLDSCKNVSQRFLGWLSATAFNVFAWRIYVVAPLTEELVFRACMMTVLLCGGFKTYNVILLGPIFFSLAHLNHFMENYIKQNYNLIKASMATGLQLGYTVVFGSYASFLYIRTGHLIAPLVAHICCNFMGLPKLSSPRSGMVTLAFIVGFLGFLWLLFPMTNPHLYNDRIDNCSCWHGYCSWRQEM